MLVPILFNLNDARADQCESEPPCAVCVCGKIKYNACALSANIRGSLLKTFSPAARVGLMHIGVFILLLLSGERNFGVRLNKPFTLRVPMDIPVFTGTHADLLIVVRGSPW